MNNLFSLLVGLILGFSACAAATVAVIRFSHKDRPAVQACTDFCAARCADNCNEMCIGFSIIKEEEEKK